MKDIQFLIKIKKKKRGINVLKANTFLESSNLLTDNEIKFHKLILDKEYISILIKLSPMLLITKLSVILYIGQSFQLKFPKYMSENIAFEFYDVDTNSNIMSEILLSTMFYMTLSLANITNIMNDIKNDLANHKKISETHFATLNKVGAYETHLMLDAIYTAFENNGLEKPDLYYNVTEH